MGSYKELEVWQLGRLLVAECYQLAKQLPREEQFGLVTQIQRAAISVPANIAEGAGRKTDPAFGAFLRNALGSVFELETLLLLAVDLGLLSSTETEATMVSLRRLGIKLQNLISSIRANVVRESEQTYAVVPDDHLTTT